LKFDKPQATQHQRHTTYQNTLNRIFGQFGQVCQYPKELDKVCPLATTPINHQEGSLTMPNSKVEMVINGMVVRCTLAQAKELTRDVTANAKGFVSTQVVYKPASEIRLAIKNITGDNAPEYVMNVLKARVSGSKPDGSMIPVHAVYSGMNTEILRRYGITGKEVTTEMAKEGLIDVRGAKGGVIISLPLGNPNVILRKATT
jgi:hypothetical protein